MKLVTSFLCLLILSLNTPVLKGQKDFNKTDSDSTNAVLLHYLTTTNEELRHIRMSDSIEKLKLEAKIDQLHTTDNLKKEELEKQLENLKNNQTRILALKKAKIDSLRSTAKSFVVHGFFQDTLFTIYSKLGSFSSHDRALVIQERIKILRGVFQVGSDSLTIIESETTADIFYNETLIMSVSENDALWNNTSTLALAKQYKVIIERAIVNYKKETSLQTIFKEIGLALIVILVFGVLIFYLLKLFKWFAKLITEEEGKKIKEFKIRNYTILDSKRQVSFLVSLTNFLKWVVLLILIYIALPILFGIFPWTKRFTTTLFGYIFDPIKVMFLGVWNYLPKLITIIIIVVVFHYVIKGIRFLKNEIERGNLRLTGFYPDWANPTFQIIRVVLNAFTLVLIFPYLPGSDSPIFKGVSVFLGVLFTFGSSGSLSNIVAGLVLTYMRLFKLGDRVKIGEVTGDIIEKSLLVTRIRTVKNEIISIPNSTVMNSHTINYTSDSVEKGLILHTTVTIGYDVPWKKMHEALLAAADRTNFILKDPKPFVLQTSLDDFYVSYQINAYTKESNKQANIYSDLHANIQDCCNEAGIEIMSPHYRAARDGNATTIPANYLDKNYQAPSFNVTTKNETKS